MNGLDGPKDDDGMQDDQRHPDMSDAPVPGDHDGSDHDDLGDDDDDPGHGYEFFDPEDEFDEEADDEATAPAVAADVGALPRKRRRRRRRPVPERKKLSQILTEIAEDPSHDRISVDNIIRAMDGRAIGALLLIFGFPNTIPAPPGTSGILGLPLLYLSSQMMLGRMPWLPKLIAGRSMPRSDFGHLVERVTPWLGWADKFMAPRLQLFVDPRAERLLGAFCLILSMVLVLPIPLGNMLPAFAICLIALGVLERDGLWVLAGIGVGTGALIIVATVVYALMRTVAFILMNAF